MSEKIYLLFASVDSHSQVAGIGELIGIFDSVEACLEAYKNGWTANRRLHQYDCGSIVDYDTMREVCHLSEAVDKDGMLPPWGGNQFQMDQLAVLLERRKLSHAIGDGILSARGNGGRL